MPGTGDDVQALKAGIMEIADIFVVNKADREGRRPAGLGRSRRTWRCMPTAPGEWRPPIVKTVATTGEGVAELVDAIEQFRDHAAAARGGAGARGANTRLRELVAQRFMAISSDRSWRAGEFAALVDRIAARDLDPYTAASEIAGPRRSTCRGAIEAHDR